MHCKSAPGSGNAALLSELYVNWRVASHLPSTADQVLLALRRYGLDDHVLVDVPVAARDIIWLLLDTVAIS